MIEFDLGTSHQLTRLNPNPTDIGNWNKMVHFLNEKSHKGDYLQLYFTFILPIIRDKLAVYLFYSMCWRVCEVLVEQSWVTCTLSLFSKPVHSDNSSGIKLCWFIAAGISITDLDTRGETEEEKSVKRGMMRKKDERHSDKFPVLYVALQHRRHIWDKSK